MKLTDRTIIKKQTGWTNGELLFLLGYFCLFAALAASMTAYYEVSGIGTALKVLRYIGYMIVFFKILLDQQERKNLIIIVVLYALLIVISRIMQDNILVTLFLFVVAMNNIEFEKISRVILNYMILAMVVIITFSKIGIIPDWIYSTADLRVRDALGYSYPSHVSSSFFYLIALFLYVRKEKLSLIEVGVIQILNYTIYRLTDSRAAFFLTTVMVIANWVIAKTYGKRWSYYDRFINGCCKSSYVLACVFSFVTAICYTSGNSVLVKLNSLLSDRLDLANSAIRTYGVQLFGQKINWVGYGGLGFTRSSNVSAYNFVDCSYIKIMLDYGLIFLVFVIVGYTASVFLAIKHKNIYLAIALSFVAVYSIIEPRLVEMGFNPFMLVLVTMLGFHEKTYYIYQQLSEECQ